MTSALYREDAADVLTDHSELTALRELARRVGMDPLLTQGSSGNCSLKRDGVLWIKASGKWMSDAMSGDFLLPLSLCAVKEAIGRGLEPADRFPGASLETALHATVPHRLVLHVHSVNTIAWAVRDDAAEKLADVLDDLPWKWIPCMPSGLPLAHAVQDALDTRPAAQVFVLGNHGLVIGADDQQDLERILAEVERRLALPVRSYDEPDREALAELCTGSRWRVPAQEGVHVLGTDLITQEILARGLLVPSQAFLGNHFRAVPHIRGAALAAGNSETSPFLVVANLGVLVSRNAPRGDIALLAGLVEVARRINPEIRLRYLTDREIRGLDTGLYRNYRERALAGHQT